MGKVAASRRVACELLGEVRRRDARSRDLLRTSERMRRLDARERGQVTRLVLGVTGAEGFLDQRIDARLRGAARLEPKVRDALRLAAYELLFLSTPTAVAVSQGVELVRGVRPRAAGLANAVLRKVASEDVPVRQAALGRLQQGVDGVDALVDAAWVSGYPQWLLERMGDARDAVALSAIEPAPVYVATNLALHSDEEARDLLVTAGLDPRDADMPGSFWLGAPAGLASSGLVENADVVVADLSAQQVARHVGAAPGMRVLEVGQGRGTKSLLLESSALREGGRARIVGVDSVEFKPKLAAERMARAGLSSDVTCLEFDARHLSGEDLPEQLAGSFDIVFVDAPCSGTGTMRRHPEIAWGLAPDDLGSLHDLQLQILSAAAAHVRVGGSLCYATCSVLRDENDDVVSEFLAGPSGKSFVLEGNPLRTYPSLSGPDGHFLARLRRS